jgi:hypothetical protein
VDAVHDSAGSGGDDDITRQRHKRRATLSGRPVPGSMTMTFGELAEQARAASPAAGADGVQRFLAASGHGPATIATVLSCLDLVASDAVGGGGAVTPMPEASARQQRQRTLAQLEALLLEE